MFSQLERAEMASLGLKYLNTKLNYHKEKCGQKSCIYCDDIACDLPSFEDWIMKLSKQKEK